MKVLEVIRSVNPAGGGPIEGLKQFGTVLERRGHTVTVASLDGPQEPFVKHFPLPLMALGPGIGSYGYNSRFVGWLRQHAQQYDVVLVDGIWQYHSYAVWRALRKLHVPYAVFTHGMLDPWFKRRYPLKHAKKWLYWPWSDYRVCRDADAILFTCEEERILARQSFWLYRAKEVVISYGTAVPEAREEQINALFQRFPELQNKRLAVFLSRIHPKKGCDLAIEAFAQTAAKDPTFRLVLAGPDQVGWQASLQEKTARLGIDDRVIWTGSLEGAVKWGLLRAAEFFLLPSHQENFGVVVAEALGCGTPVLISNKVNIYREIETSQAGLVASDNLAGTSNMIERWLQMNSTDQRRMGERARQCFEERFDIESAAGLLVNALQKVITGRDSNEEAGTLATAASPGGWVS